MVPVNKTVDVIGAVRAAGLRSGVDYRVFLDSTLARFWYLNDTAQARVRAALEGVDGLNRITEEQLRRYRIGFNNRAYGDDIFLVGNNTIVLPNYFQTAPVLGMHGYPPEVPEQKGILISSLPGFRDIEIDYVDIFPTVLVIAGLPSPGACDGRSVFKENGEN
jgi:hypothetical protein